MMLTFDFTAEVASLNTTITTAIAVSEPTSGAAAQQCQ